MTNINVKQAARNAIEFLQEIQFGRELGEILVEEVFFDPEEGLWLIVLSHEIPGASTTIAAMTGNVKTRTYKRIAVNAANGEVMQMQVWNPS